MFVDCDNVKRCFYKQTVLVYFFFTLFTITVFCRHLFDEATTYTITLPLKTPMIFGSALYCYYTSYYCNVGGDYEFTTQIKHQVSIFIFFCSSTHSVYRW